MFEVGRLTVVFDFLRVVGRKVQMAADASPKLDLSLATCQDFSNDSNMGDARLRGCFVRVCSSLTS